MMHHIRRIRPKHRLPGSWTFLHDNAGAHTSTLLTRFHAENKITVLSRPPSYSPDLAPADYFSFPKPELKIKGHFFDDIPAIQRACTKQLKAIPQNEFSRAFEHSFTRDVTSV